MLKAFVIKLYIREGRKLPFCAALVAVTKLVVRIVHSFLN